MYILGGNRAIRYKSGHPQTHALRAFRYYPYRSCTSPSISRKCEYAALSNPFTHWYINSLVHQTSFTIHHFPIAFLPAFFLCLLSMPPSLSFLPLVNKFPPG